MFSWIFYLFFSLVFQTHEQSYFRTLVKMIVHHNEEYFRDIVFVWRSECPQKAIHHKLLDKEVINSYK